MALSPEYDHPGAYLLLRRRGNTVVSLYRTPQCALNCRTSATPALNRPSSISHHMAKAKTAIAPIHRRFPAHFAGVPSDLNLGRLDRPCFRARASSRRTYAFLLPRKGLLEAPSIIAQIRDRRSLS